MAIAAPFILTNSQPSHHPAADRYTAVSHLLQLWRSRHRERHALDYVDDRALNDLGLSRWQVRQELAKPFWRG